ncbi:Transcription initiation factor TFIIIB, partial [Dysosmobacter welbionis]
FRMAVLRLFRIFQLRQLLHGPGRQVPILQHPDKIRPVPACHLSVTQAGATDRPANGVGAAPCTIVGVP